MRTSESIDKISEALASAQAEFKPIIKNKKNPHFKNEYADLSAFIDATRAALSKNGIFVFQSSEITESRINVLTLLSHKTGQWMESKVSLKIGIDTPQGMGSALTYGRRYGRSMALDLSAAEDDDDAEGTKEEETEKKLYPPKQTAIAKPLESSRAPPLIKAFEKYQVSQVMLEEYVRKPHPQWNKDDLDEIMALGADFKDGKKDKEGLIQHMSIRDL